MNPKEKNKRLEDLAKSGYGEALLEYIQENISEMKDISTVKTFEEMVGRQEAVKMLKSIFRFLDKKREKKGEKTKNQYL